MATRQRQYHKILLIHILGSPKHSALSLRRDEAPQHEGQEKELEVKKKKTEGWLGWPGTALMNKSYPFCFWAPDTSAVGLCRYPHDAVHKFQNGRVWR